MQPRDELPLENAPAKFYATQVHNDLKHTITCAIQGAKKSIFLVIFCISDKEILQELKEKAQQGVQVTIISDARHCPSLKRFFDEKVVLEPRQGLKGLMHRKILIVDEKWVWLGSANFTLESLWLHDNLLCGMFSPPLASAILDTYRAPQKKTAKVFDIGGQQVELWMLPQDKEALGRLLQLINEAKKTVRLAMFTLTHPQLVDALIAAHERGVVVQAALDDRSCKGASYEAYRKLKNAGIAIGTNIGQQLLHHKFVWIDDTTLCNGSANWTKAAFQQNEDDFLIHHSLDASQIQFMSHLWREIQLFLHAETSEPSLLEAMGF